MRQSSIKIIAATQCAGCPCWKGLALKNVHDSSLDILEHQEGRLERQDLSCTYLAHHELESVIIIVIITTINIIRGVGYLR